MAETRIYWLHALSPTHAGIGRGLDYIDLPIDRDKVTGWPIIRGSAYKGVWADHFGATEEARKQKDKPQDKPLLRIAFGIVDGDNANSGALIPTDAQLVCLPVRSFRGTFAWATSPLCLKMLHRTLTLAKVPGLPDAPTGLAESDAHHAAETVLVEGNRLFLEDLDFMARNCNTANAWAEMLARWVFPGEEKSDESWRDVFVKRFAVLPDSAFDFLCRTGTEVHTRVKIHDEFKVVEKGMLWTEESLPAETILAGIIQCDRVFGPKGEDITTTKLPNGEIVTPTGLLDHFASTKNKEPLILQIGGKATVGRGRMRCVFTPVGGGDQ